MTDRNAWRARVLGVAPATMTAMTAMMALCSGVAWAQDGALRPPRTADEPSSPKYLMFALALLLAGAVVFVVTLKTKRGHQD